MSSKVLILMNSYRQIEILRSYLVELYDPSLIITQTSDVNTLKLNEQFNTLDNGIFLATQTFYEGVDFKYDGFKTVMIISLPFMHPDDLNIMLMRDEVNDVFMDYQLPGAVLENMSSKVLILMNSYRQIEILRSYLVELYDPS
ncbi:helicase C-terminal domain-containing protein, partial [Mammaliicoccus sciuri]|uniref:helicase C-terminal domain-containing protein n=1 Tax=Mammaliicoccus sciuri TaxID=1296 RepID=UPI0030CA244F